MSAPSKERQEWFAIRCDARKESYEIGMGYQGRCFVDARECPKTGRPDCPALAEMPVSDDYDRGLEDGRRDGEARAEKAETEIGIWKACVDNWKREAEKAERIVAAVKDVAEGWMLGDEEICGHVLRDEILRAEEGKC